MLTVGARLALCNCHPQRGGGGGGHWWLAGAGVATRTADPCGGGGKPVERLCPWAGE